MTSRTLSSMPLRPSFQVSCTRTAYCSTGSGWVVGTSSTAIWLPLRASNSARVCSRAARWFGFNVLVKSVTRDLSGGTAIAAAATPIKKSLLSREVNFRRLRDRLFVLYGELRLVLEAEQHGGEIARERAHRDVVLLHRLDVALARHRDAVLGALELRLEVAEVGVGLELRVALGDHQQPRQRRGQLALRGGELLERGRIVDQLRRRLDRAHPGARVGDVDQHLLLLRGEALDRVDQVRHQVGAALVLVQHLGPRGLDLLVLALQVVVAAAAEGEQRRQRQRETGEFLHGHLPWNQNLSARCTPGRAPISFAQRSRLGISPQVSGRAFFART